MIYLVTGGIGQGKSRLLRKIYEQRGQGDGFVNRRILRKSMTVGQDLVRLSTGESRTFSRRDGFIPEGWDERCRYGGYSFSDLGLSFAEGIIAEAIGNGTYPLFIDEIGPLELEGHGLAASFIAACRAGQDLYAAVREVCLNEVIEAFHLDHWEIIHVDSISNSDPESGHGLWFLGQGNDRGEDGS